MAEAFPETDNSVCPHCNHTNNKTNVEESNFKEEAGFFLLDALYKNEDERYFNVDYETEHLSVPIYVICSCCGKEYKVFVEILAEPEYDYGEKYVEEYDEDEDEDGDSDRSCRIVAFGITLIGIKPPNKDMCLPSPYVNIPHFDEDYFNEYHEYHSDELTESISEEIDLRIIAITNMKKGCCVMAYDEINRKVLRPIYRTRPSKCCWDSKNLVKFQLGMVYNFSVFGRCVTPLPHGNEDIFCSENIVEVDCAEFDPEILRNVAKRQVEDIFIDIQEGRYVNDLTNCPSAGVLLSKSNELEIYTKLCGRNRRCCKKGSCGKKRCKIEGCYDFPITGLTYDEPDKNANTEVIVLLGLARPWTNDGKFDPARCTILVIGILELK